MGVKVSVIIANRNDLEMLAVTVRSCIEELTAVPGGGEVVIVDNSDEKIYKLLRSVIPSTYVRQKKVRIFRQDYPCLFTAREEAARQAKGHYIFCVDSHCIIGHNTIIDAVHFANRNRARPLGFVHVPVNWLDKHESWARHDMKDIHGTWGKLYKKESKMSWKGMPWMCRRGWFLKELGGYGALSQHKMSWGGGDMHLGLKSWMLGYENWAVPTRPVIHIGPFPKTLRKGSTYRYRLYSKSGEHFAWLGFLVSLYTVGGEAWLDTKKFKAFMQERNGVNVEQHKELAMKLAADEREWISKHKKIGFRQLVDNPLWAVNGNETTNKKIA